MHLQHYELRFESDDKRNIVSTMLDGTFEQVMEKACNVARRRLANNLRGTHVLICPDGREVMIDQLQMNQSR